MKLCRLYRLLVFNKIISLAKLDIFNKINYFQFITLTMGGKLTDFNNI